MPSNYNAVEDLILKFLGNKNSKLKGCEVGVREGYFSNYLLSRFPELTMTCVDPYLPYQDHSMFYGEEYQNPFKEQAMSLLSKYEDRATLVIDYSVKASLLYPESFFDFIYIDAQHTYESALQDITAWIKKLHVSGIMSGHDYSMLPVKKAADEVAKAYGKNLKHTSLGDGDTWYFII